MHIFCTRYNVCSKRVNWLRREHVLNKTYFISVNKLKYKKKCISIWSSTVKYHAVWLFRQATGLTTVIKHKQILTLLR